MKSLNLVLLAFLLTGVAAAQTSSSTGDAPGVAVIESSWRKEEYNSKLDQDPLLAADRQVELERARKDDLEQGRIREPLVQIGMPKTRPGRYSVRYVYKVKISNTGAKTIQGLVWVYALLDPDTGRVIGSRRFKSVVSIRPGKSKSLVANSEFPPASAVDTKRPGKYPERVVIHRIEYNDGSVWERPPK